MRYTLYNKSTSKILHFRKNGDWFTEDKSEAIKLMYDFYEYLDKSKLSNVKKDIVLYDLDEGKELELTII